MATDEIPIATRAEPTVEDELELLRHACLRLWTMVPHNARVCAPKRLKLLINAIRKDLGIGDGVHKTS